ncbi:MAG: PhnD/SsuA/transferrin family substrate-binding protein [Nitrospinales bacterium]
MKRLHLIYIVISVIALLSSTPLNAGDKDSVTFIGVALDPETKAADEKLREYVSARVPIEFEKQEMEYGVAINSLVQWNVEEQGPVMARVTPYVYVVAEMLGADIEVLGTYLSKKSNKTTYNSYFVVKKSFYSGSIDQGNFVQHLEKQTQPAKFIFHNKFSTSSYFLPSLYFRQNRIFSIKTTDNIGQGFIPIIGEKPKDISGSSSLVRMVKNGEADFAAVWDGTKNKFENDPELLFMKLPNSIPNDLLVYSKSGGQAHKNQIIAAIQQMKDEDINTGDFQKWIDFQQARQARKALASLRWLAKVPPPPVTVKIRRDHKDESIKEQHLEAAKQALRLSGTELILFDEDYHKTFDALWTLKMTHEDSLVITSEFVSAGIKQEFPVSFKRNDMVSLTSRIGHIISEKMHRIRYIWPFDDENPQVLRDIDFTIPAKTVIKAQKITWVDFNKNEYIIDTPFDVSVVKSDFNSFQLGKEGFPKKESGNKLDFDPMSNINYRIFLMRGGNNQLVLQFFTVSLILLFTLAALFAFLDVKKKYIKK